MTDEHNAVSVWVLHSPYPDGTWRGMEKCCSNEGGPILFSSEQAALDFIVEKRLEGNGYVAVRCVLITPLVRRSLKLGMQGDYDA